LVQAVTNTDVTWKESRIWLNVDEPRLLEEDRIEITVSSTELIAPSARVRIANSLQQSGTVRASNQMSILER
jgi:hypothetical protein